MLHVIPMSEPSKAAFFDPSLLMISELNSDLIEEIKALQADRQKHAEAITAIDAVLTRIGQTLTTMRGDEPRNGEASARPPEAAGAGLVELSALGFPPVVRAR